MVTTHRYHAYHIVTWYVDYHTVMLVTTHSLSWLPTYHTHHGYHTVTGYHTLLTMVAIH